MVHLNLSMIKHYFQNGNLSQKESDIQFKVEIRGAFKHRSPFGCIFATFLARGPKKSQ